MSITAVRRSKLRIKDLPLEARPREKLVAKGGENLADEELVAILLGTGSPKQNVLLLSKRVLKRYPLTVLPTLSLQELMTEPGIGKSKASRILAAVELGNRIFSEEALTKVIIRSTKDILQQVRDIAVKKQEYLQVLYLNSRYELVQKETIGQGGLNKMLITPREIFSPALQTPCAGIIMVHNHPSQDPSPSDDDIAFTTRIQEAGEVMGISLLDHLIVTSKRYFSFRDSDAKE